MFSDSVVAATPPAGCSHGGPGEKLGISRVRCGTTASNDGLLRNQISFGHGLQCDAAQERAMEGHQVAILLHIVPFQHQIVCIERGQQWVAASCWHDP